MWRNEMNNMTVPMQHRVKPENKEIIKVELPCHPGSEACL